MADEEIRKRGRGLLVRVTLALLACSVCLFAWVRARGDPLATYGAVWREATLRFGQDCGPSSAPIERLTCRGSSAAERRRLLAIDMEDKIERERKVLAALRSAEAPPGAAKLQSLTLKLMGEILVDDEQQVQEIRGGGQITGAVQSGQEGREADIESQIVAEAGRLGIDVPAGEGAR